MNPIYAYERTPYVSELEVEVLESGEDDGRDYAVLDDTILYPGGGGQPEDRGLLGDAVVTGVARTPTGLRHYLDRPVPGGRDRLFLDWPRRFDHMQQHTAQHLITAVTLDRFGWKTTSFHLGDDVSDIELDVGAVSEPDLERLEEWVSLDVRAARTVRAWRVSLQEYQELGVRGRGLPDHHAGDVRLVEIADVDVTACGGTHLSSTAEIEVVKLLDTEPMRGGTRLRWVAGRRTRRRLAQHEIRSRRLREMVGAADAEMPDVVARKLDQLKDALRARKVLESSLADETAARLASEAAQVVEAHFDRAEPALAQAVARRFASTAPDRVALITSSAEGGHFFVVAAGDGASIDLRAVGSAVAEVLEGRGGGAGGLFQGRAGSLERREEALALLRERLG